VHIGLLVFFSLLVLISAGLIWKLRNHSRFQKIRPVEISWAVLGGSWLCEFSALLDEVIGMNCAVRMFCFLLGLAIFAVSIFSRAMVISFEAQFSLVARKMKVLSNLDNEEGQSQGTSQSVAVFSAKTTLRSTGILFRVAFGRVKLEQLTFHEVKGALGSYWLFGVLSFLPGVFVGLLVILLSTFGVVFFLI
jgi:hypothetical protein